jgi:hypothetical protein
MISSASASGESVPITSASSWWNWRKRPACGRSWRKYGPQDQSFTGWASLCMPCSTYARMIPAVPSGRSVSPRPPWSSKLNISFWTMSVDWPIPRANSSVSSNAGVSIRP